MEDINQIQNKITKDDLKDSVKELNKEIKTARKESLKIILMEEGKGPILEDVIKAFQQKLVMILNAMDERKIKAAKLAPLIKGLRIISDNMVKMSTGVDKIIEHRNKNININIDLNGKNTEELLKALDQTTNDREGTI